VTGSGGSRRTRIAIAGASGSIGRALSSHLGQQGHTIIGIGRGGKGDRVDVRWDPSSGDLDPEALRGIDVAINLSGEPIDQRWTDDAKRRIRESRVQSTNLLAKTCAILDPPPRTFISISAVGAYGDRRDELVDESSATGTGFLADVVGTWEAAAEPARRAGIRVVHPRVGMVLHPDGGALRRMLPFFKLGAGARVGRGKQWMSWIAHSDLTRVLAWLALDSALDGVVNATSPNPVRNEEFTRTLARVLNRPAIGSVPSMLIGLMYGQMGEETVVAGQRVVPRRLLDSGFAFDFPDLEAALRHEMRAHGG
jgi:uncharacterized protein (TIGR01777 family)